MRTEQQLLEEINRDLPPGVDWKAGAERYVRELVARGGAPFRQWHLTKPFLAEPLAGEPLHWARGKSDDHEDCLERHTTDAMLAATREERVLHMANRAWRALAALQLECEKLEAEQFA